MCKCALFIYSSVVSNKEQKRCSRRQRERKDTKQQSMRPSNISSTVFLCYEEKQEFVISIGRPSGYEKRKTRGQIHCVLVDDTRSTEEYRPVSVFRLTMRTRRFDLNQLSMCVKNKKNHRLCFLINRDTLEKRKTNEQRNDGNNLRL